MSPDEKHAHQVELYRAGRFAELLTDCQGILGTILARRGMKGDAFDEGRQELNRHALEMFRGKRCSPWDCGCRLSTYLWPALDGALLTYLKKRDRHRTIPAQDLIAFGYAVAMPGETSVAAPAAHAKSRKRMGADQTTPELRLRGANFSDHHHDDDGMLDGHRTPAGLVDIIIHAGDQDRADGLEGYTPEQIKAVFDATAKLIGEELVLALHLHLTPIDRKAKLARFAELFGVNAGFRFDRRVALAQKKTSKFTPADIARLEAAASAPGLWRDAPPVTDEERRELIEAPIPVYEDDDEILPSTPSTDAPSRSSMSADDVLWLAQRHQPAFRPDSLDLYLQVIEK